MQVNHRIPEQNFYMGVTAAPAPHLINLQRLSRCGSLVNFLGKLCPFSSTFIHIHQFSSIFITLYIFNHFLGFVYFHQISYIVVLMQLFLNFIQLYIIVSISTQIYLFYPFPFIFHCFPFHPSLSIFIIKDIFGTKNITDSKTVCMRTITERRT